MMVILGQNTFCKNTIHAQNIHGMAQVMRAQVSQSDGGTESTMHTSLYEISHQPLIKSLMSTFPSEKAHQRVVLKHADNA